LRDLFGNPFRAVSLDPAWMAWHGGLIVAMARHMYETRDFADFAMLGGLLEEAGCRDEQVLAHCRSGQEHARGCHVVDLVLGKL
jgi:hypothetical protein